MRAILVFFSGTIRPIELDFETAPKELDIVDRKRGPVRFRFWQLSETGAPMYEEIREAGGCDRGVVG